MISNPCALRIEAVVIRLLFGEEHRAAMYIKAQH